MSKVFVIDTKKRPLLPVHPAVARKLLKAQKAAIFRQFPFTIILYVACPDAPVKPLRLKLDPGAKTTGIAIVDDASGVVVAAAELEHKGFAIRGNLKSRSQLRRGRRRVYNIETWVKRFQKYANITALSQELVRFDTQLMQNPDIQGKEYQQGELAGYETREYLLEKFGRSCQYCDKEGVPLQIEHIVPKASGGSNRLSNLTLSCEKCNQKKSSKSIEVFLKKDTDRLAKIRKSAKKPMADTAAVNATRFKLLETLKATGLPVETGSGGLTKFNRAHQKLEKTHWIDAAAVGASTPILKIKSVKPLLIKSTGHGSRQAMDTNKFGFPDRKRPKVKFVHGFQTGDIVKAVVTKGKKIGTYRGRVAIRSSGSFNISTECGLVQGIGYKNCKTIHKKDGYGYSFNGN